MGRIYNVLEWKAQTGRGAHSYNHPDRCAHAHAHTQVRAHVHSPHTDLVVENNNVVGVCIEPGVHGLADTAYLLQGRSVQIRPAKFQDLGVKHK